MRQQSFETAQFCCPPCVSYSTVLKVAHIFVQALRMVLTMSLEQ
jgi:hypothetical protein